MLNWLLRSALSLIGILAEAVVIGLIWVFSYLWSLIWNRLVSSMCQFFNSILESFFQFVNGISDFVANWFHYAYASVGSSACGTYIIRILLIHVHISLRVSIVTVITFFATCKFSPPWIFDPQLYCKI